jgi:TetR/AcrR family transcriptional regulator, upper aerobic nicotinate degradation pathway regulator
LDYYLAHPEMLTILNNENLHKGRYVTKSRNLKELSSPALDLILRIYRRGVENGTFREDVDPVHLYLSILALNYFYVSNRYTLSAFLGVDLTGERLDPWRSWVAITILRAVQK